MSLEKKAVAVSVGGFLAGMTVTWLLLRKENRMIGASSNNVPKEAIQASEEARRPLRRGWKGYVVQGSKKVKGDPYSEDRVSKLFPAKEEVSQMTPDDTVFPG